MYGVWGSPDVCIQNSLLLEAVQDQMVGLLVFIKQQQLTEVHCIHLEGHPRDEKERERERGGRGERKLLNNE